jgi:hypothetical protein
MMTLKKEMTVCIPDRSECKQQLGSFESHEEGTSQDSAASLFEVYLQEQANLSFHQPVLSNNNNHKKKKKKKSMRMVTKTMANLAVPTAAPTTMPLPSIRLAFGSVGCVLYVPESIERSAIVDQFDLQFESRMRLQGHNGNNSGKLKENAIAI